LPDRIGSSAHSSPYFLCPPLIALSTQKPESGCVGTMFAKLRRGKDVKPKKLDDSIRLVGKLSSGCLEFSPFLELKGVRRLPGRFYALRHFIDQTISSKRTPWLFFSADFLDLIDRMVTFFPQHSQRFGDMGKRIFLTEVHKTVPSGHHGLMIVGPDGNFAEEGID